MVRKWEDQIGVRQCCNPSLSAFFLPRSIVGHGQRTRRGCKPLPDTAANAISHIPHPRFSNLSCGHRTPAQSSLNILLHPHLILIHNLFLIHIITLFPIPSCSILASILLISAGLLTWKGHMAGNKGSTVVPPSKGQLPQGTGVCEEQGMRWRRRRG